MKPAAALLATLALALCARVAQAGSAEDEARRAFQEGLTEEQNGRASACGKFRKSLELIREIGPLKKVKECDVRENKLLFAREKLRELVSRWPQQDAELEALKAELSSVEGRIAHLELALRPGAPAGVVARVDAKAVPVPSSDVELDPGEHEVLVDVPGQPMSRSMVTLGDGERKRLEVPAEQKPAPPAAGPSRVQPSGGLSGLGIAGLVIGGVGVAGLIGGAVTGGMVLSKQGEFEDCRDRGAPAGCDAQAIGDSGDTLLAVNGALFIAGGVVAALGTTLFIIDVVAPSSEPAASARVRVGPAGADLVLRF
jgi:hypothetical protein